MGLVRCRRCRGDSISRDRAFSCPQGGSGCDLFYQEPWLELMVKVVLILSAFIGIFDLVFNAFI